MFIMIQNSMDLSGKSRIPANKQWNYKCHMIFQQTINDWGMDVYLLNCLAKMNDTTRKLNTRNRECWQHCINCTAHLLHDTITAVHNQCITAAISTLWSFYYNITFTVHYGRKTWYHVVSGNDAASCKWTGACSNTKTLCDTRHEDTGWNDFLCTFLVQLNTAICSKLIVEWVTTNCIT